MADLGVINSGNKTSFALYSKHATGVILRLFERGGDQPIQQVALSREGDIWSITLENLPKTFEYTYRCDGPFNPHEGHFFNKDIDLLDPYAKETNRTSEWKGAQKPLRGVYSEAKPFDWEQDSRPLIPEKKTILYELHVRGFTVDPSSKTEHGGTFLGLIEKIPHLEQLGVNAVELLPIHSFDENGNYWGYSTINFFALMSPYGTPEDFKKMVKALHKAHIEVILDVVYNHTNEDPNKNESCSFRGIDNATYYLYDKEKYLNYTGCGNTLNCNHPIVQELILDSLRYFVTEYHVDGFRFDLASILTRGMDGEALENPPLIQRITRDPILGPTKLIAEAWDAVGLYQVGTFPSYRFGEWNDQFRNDVRLFMKSEGNWERMKSRLMGSPDLFGSPDKSYNYVTIHDGFSLRDVVSYNQKHNEANGEGNRDGMNDNQSWNCGVEGATDNPDISFFREKQMRNFFLALLIAKGVPMLRMGDEYGHTQNGNNNVWCQDNRLSYFLWDVLEKNSALFSYVSKLISFRKAHARREWIWFQEPFLAALIDHTILLAFNPSQNTHEWTLPKKKWIRLIDTHLPQAAEEKISSPYHIQPYSAILFIAT